MFGKIIEKHCASCDKNIKINIAHGYRVDGNLYCVDIYCPTCGLDLCVEDKKVLAKARSDKKKITVFMY